MSSLVLGIHFGHHSTCAVVKNGELVAAAQLERSSRIKHHPVLGLSNQLNVELVLREAGATIRDVDLIVSSFQATAPAGFGLDRPLIEPSFSLFDPWAANHLVLSHHLAHSHSAFDPSGFDDAAVLVCDYAGSSTIDGGDFELPFEAWYRQLTSHTGAFEPKTECFSIYGASRSAAHRVVHREHNIAHMGQASFVYSIAGLYENVTQYVMRAENSHGQMMALAAYGAAHVGMAWDPGPLVVVEGDHQVRFRNDWQHAAPVAPTSEQKACFAYRCQEATELALLAYAARARELVGSENLAVAGGVFLNILANTALTQRAGFKRFHVPSAPHDAGIAVGCAFFGARKLGERARRVTTDRLGPTPTEAELQDALSRRAPFVSARRYQESEVLDALSTDKIVARFNGRAELGPRALGGRSLLASPRYAAIKDRMNAIKGRQTWRPVAPMVPQDCIEHFFDGPVDSWWMTKSHEIRPEHRADLPALAHPDCSTRAQTLVREQDPELYRWLHALGDRTGYPILVNTSLNRGGEPIVERPSDAIEMFLARPDIDILLLGPWLVEREDPIEVQSGEAFRLADRVFLTVGFEERRRTYNVTHGSRSWRISEKMYQTLSCLGTEAMKLGSILALSESEDSTIPLIYELLLHDVITR